MDRRDFLKRGAVAGGAGAALQQSGCAHGPAHPETAAALPDLATAEAVAGSLDRRLDWIDQQRALPASLGIPAWQAETADERAAQERHGRLFRQSLRTLYLTGRFLDLPSELQTSPHVQARVAAAQPEMDEAVLGMTAMLESLGPEDHRRIHDTLKRHPDIGERVAAMLDDTAREDGIPIQRRMSLRTSTLQLAAKMTTQSPALTVDPYVRRVRRIEARPHSPTEQERVLASRVGEEAFWEHQRRLADLQKRWSQKLAQAGAPSPTAPKAPAAAPAPPPPSRGSSVVSTGGKIMGFGAGSVAVGLICAGLVELGAEAFLWPALIFGVTVGPILLVIGLIVVIVGAIMKAAE